MIRTQVSLEGSQYEKAKEEAARRGISFAELVRQAVDLVLANTDHSDQPWMRFAGCVEGSEDDSTSVDEVVYGRHRT